MAPTVRRRAPQSSQSGPSLILGVVLLTGIALYLCVDGLLGVISPAMSVAGSRHFLHPERSQQKQAVVGAALAVLGLALGYVCLVTEGRIALAAAFLCSPLVVGGLIMVRLDREQREALLAHLEVANLRAYAAIELFLGSLALLVLGLLG